MSKQRNRAIALVKSILPGPVAERLWHTQGGPTRARLESNAWLRMQCRDITGTVLSLGSGDDSDGQGGRYRDYFPSGTRYFTSEVKRDFNCDLVIDIRAMPEIRSECFDCIYCSGVLEHVDDVRAGLAEITRILKPRGILLLGLPFRQAIHMAPQDFWRFTEHGIRRMLLDSYDIEVLTPIDSMAGEDFPAAYWVRAARKPA